MQGLRNPDRHDGIGRRDRAQIMPMCDTSTRIRFPKYVYASSPFIQLPDPQWKIYTYAGLSRTLQRERCVNACRAALEARFKSRFRFQNDDYVSFCVSFVYCSFRSLVSTSASVQLTRRFRFGQAGLVCLLCFEVRTRDHGCVVCCHDMSTYAELSSCRYRARLSCVP